MHRFSLNILLDIKLNQDPTFCNYVIISIYYIIISTLAGYYILQEGQKRSGDLLPILLINSTEIPTVLTGFKYSMKTVVTEYAKIIQNGQQHINVTK